MEMHTERCVVRNFEEYDMDGFMSYRNDLEWMKYQGFKGLTRQEYVKALMGHHSIGAGMQFAVIAKAGNAIIGDIYLKQEGSVFWIGYTISPLSARQGYAYEVVSAVCAELGAKGVTAVKAGVAPDNTASIALLKKLNFINIGPEGHGEEEIYFLEL